MVDVLEAVTMEEMRRYLPYFFAWFSFILFVQKLDSLDDLDGLQMDITRLRWKTGCLAAWANKKYRGHCVLPETLMKDMKEAGMK